MATHTRSGLHRVARAAVVCATALGAAWAAAEDGDEAELAHRLSPVLSLGEQVANRQMVFMREDATEEQFQAVQAGCRAFGGTVEDVLAFGGLEASMRVVACDIDSVAPLARLPGVASIEADHYLVAGEGAAQALSCPAQRGGTWGLNRVTPGGGFANNAAWGEGTDAYVLDTGVRCSHREFEGRCTWGANFAGGGDWDSNGHGTHVAGTIAGRTYGVARAARVFAVKVLGPSGSVYANLRGIDFAVQRAQRTGRRGVINMSLEFRNVQQALNNGINAAVAAGVPVVVAAGNGATDACRISPASARDAITVGNSDSNNMQVSGSNYGRCVDIVAPGTGVLSAGSNGDTATRYLSGTSMAAPHVAGAVAAFLSENPTATSADVQQWLVSNARRGVVRNTRGSPNLLLYIPCGAGPTPVPPPATPQPPATPAPLPVPSWCSDSFTESFDSTGSFAYPVSGQYANNQERCFKIQCDGTVTLTWTRFDLEKGYDYVFVLRVAENGEWTQMSKRDGNRLPSRESHPGDVIVFIRTDQGVTARGFAFNWQCA